MISIRFATPDDAAELLEIYRPYVMDTAISFEYEVPSVTEFRGRIENIQKKYPYIVAVQESQNNNGYDGDTTQSETCLADDTADDTVANKVCNDRLDVLNAESDNQLSRIVGYAYAGAFNERSAYDWAVEMTVYVKKECRKDGIGRKLYEEMEHILGKMNVLNLNSCIGYPVGDDDEHLTKNSVEFHTHMGYSMVGRFHKCGYKFGKWYDMVWMEKMIGEHMDDPKPFINVNDISWC